MSASSKLQNTIRSLSLAGKMSSPPHIDISPGCTFGAVVDQRLKDMEERLDEVKSRLNGLIFLVAGAVVVEVVTRLLG